MKQVTTGFVLQIQSVVETTWKQPEPPSVCGQKSACNVPLYLGGFISLELNTSNDGYNNVVVKHIKFEVETGTWELSHPSNYQNTPPCALTSQGTRLSFLLKQMVLSACCKVTKFKLLQTKNQFQSCAALTEMALPSSPLCCSVEELEHGAQWGQNVTERPGAWSKALPGTHPTIAEQRLKATFNFPGVEFGIVIPTQRAGSKLYEIVEYVKASCEDLIQIISQWYNDGLG